MKIRNIWVIFFLLWYSLFTPIIQVYSSEFSHYDEENNVVTLYPTGVDDTENLKAAFQTVIDGGLGGTVRLSEGEFTISEEIVVVNFDGSFKGGGIGKTTLKNMYTEEWPHRTEEHFPDIAGLFLFYQTDELVHNYHISDMKIIVQGKTYEYGMMTGMNVFDIIGRVNGDKTDFYETEMNTLIENVHFQGNKLDVWHGGNIIAPYQVAGEFVVTDAWYFKPISGTHIIRNCVFDIACGPAGRSMNGYMLIENNTISNAFSGGAVYDPANIADESNVVVRGNAISNMVLMGFWLFGAENVLFEDNRILNCTGNGLTLNYCSNNWFLNNEISYCMENGVSLESSSDNVFVNTTLKGNRNDFFWEGQGGEILFDDNIEVNSIQISNHTTEMLVDLQDNFDKIGVEKDTLEAELESERDECESLEYKIGQATDDIEELEKELNETVSEITHLNSELGSTYSMSFVAIVAVVVAIIGGITGYIVSKQ